MASGPTIVAKFVADTSGLTNGVDTATSKASSSMSGFAKTAGVIVGGAFVADKLVEFGTASVEAASADAEAQAQLAAALKNTTGATDAQVAAAEEYVSNLSKSAAITDDELRPALAQLTRGFGDTESAQAALTLATDVAAGTGKDLASVTSAMSKAAMGQTGALKKLGVETENADGSAKSLDEIMADMAKTFEGQAATAANSTAGQMRSAEIAMGEMQETIGTALLPVIGKLATFLNDTLLPALTTTFGWLMDNKEVVIAAVVGIGAVLLPLFISWAAGAAAAAAATILAAAPFILIGAAVAALAYLIFTNWDAIVAATQEAWGIITGVVSGAWDSIKGAAVAVWDWIQGTWSTVTGYITAPIQAAIDWISGVPATILGFFDGMLDDVTSIFGDIGSAISGAFKTAFNSIAGWWNSSVGQIGFTVPSWVPGLGGKGFDIPNVPTLATGGMITSTGLVYAHAGEVIAPIDKVPGFGGPAVHIENATFNDPVDAELLAKRLEFALSSGLSM